jgi:uncharacterized SAM-binding protein YcdF (DUF218 family)
MSLPAVSVALLRPLEPYPALVTQVPIPKEAQAIVVLSAGRHSHAREYGGDTVDELTLERIRYGAYLKRLTGLPLYVTGGRAEHETESMAQLMERVLRDELGSPVAAVESESHTTWENALFTKPLLVRDGVRHILLVSHAWHLPRGVEAFERVGIAVTPAPTAFSYRPPPVGDGSTQLLDWLPQPGAFMGSYYAIHEHLGRVFYQIRAWIEGGAVPAPEGGASASVPARDMVVVALHQIAQAVLADHLPIQGEHGGHGRLG